MREKVVLIGAGSVAFTRGLAADLILSGEDYELALVDTEPAALEMAEGLTRKMAAAVGSDLCVTASTERRALLRGATVVVCTISVGGRRARELDIQIPRKHGVFQAVGDTAGPGGASRALRMIPAMVDIARDVQDLAPDALFFNYGNPMTPICRAVRKATGAELVGLCSGVTEVAHYLAGALEVPPETLDYTALGLNHMTWFTELRTGGADLMPRLRARAAARVARMREASPEPDDFPFAWTVAHLFDAYPAVHDRHIAEFFPHLFPGGRYYGRTLGVDAFAIDPAVAAGDRRFEHMRELALSPDPLPREEVRRSGGEQEHLVDIVRALRSDAHEVHSVNLPNTGQIPNLPPGGIVESPAVVSAGRLRPLAQPPLPSALAQPLAARLHWFELVVEAALEGSRDKFVQALVLDGAVDCVDRAAPLADELLAAHAQHLPWARGQDRRVTGSASPPPSGLGRA